MRPAQILFHPVFVILSFTCCRHLLRISYLLGQKQPSPFTSASSFFPAIQ